MADGTQGRWPNPPWDGTDEEWRAYMATRPYRLRHPNAFAMQMICAALIVAVVVAWVQHLITGR